VYGENGFLQVRGLGGSYGEEELVVGRRNLHGGPPETVQIGFSPEETTEARNDVWALEWQAFVSAVLDPDPSASIQPVSAIDAWQALRIVEAAYEASRTGASLPLRRLATSASHLSLPKALATASRLQENNDSV
jgi:predicted dehydrogenase